MSRTLKQGALALLMVSGLALSGCNTLTPKNKVAATNLCEDLRVGIYFEQDSAAITKEAKTVLKEAADMRKGCTVGVVDVLGLADAVGDPAANQVLSEQRAKAVTKALGGLGFGKVNIAAAGSSGAVTAAGEARPLRRRAEVVFRSTGG